MNRFRYILCLFSIIAQFLSSWGYAGTVPVVGENGTMVDGMAGRSPSGIPVVVRVPRRASQTAQYEKSLSSRPSRVSTRSSRRRADGMTTGTKILIAVLVLIFWMCLLAVVLGSRARRAKRVEGASSAKAGEPGLASQRQGSCWGEPAKWWELKKYSLAVWDGPSYRNAIKASIGRYKSMPKTELELMKMYERGDNWLSTKDRSGSYADIAILAEMLSKAESMKVPSLDRSDLLTSAVHELQGIFEKSEIAGVRDFLTKRDFALTDWSLGKIHALSEQAFPSTWALREAFRTLKQCGENGPTAGIHLEGAKEQIRDYGRLWRGWQELLEQLPDDARKTVISPCEKSVEKAAAVKSTLREKTRVQSTFMTALYSLNRRPNGTLPLEACVALRADIYKEKLVGQHTSSYASLLGMSTGYNRASLAVERAAIAEEMLKEVNCATEIELSRKAASEIFSDAAKLEQWLDKFKAPVP